MRALARRPSSIAMTVAGVVTLAVSPAQAAPGDWAVTQGGVKSLTNVGNVIFQNINTGVVATCTSSSMNANFPNKSNVNATVGTVTAMSFSSPANPGGSCTAPAPVSPRISAQGFPWTLVALSYTAPVVTGRISGVKFNFTDEYGCELTIAGPAGNSGEVGFKYNNSTGRLTFLGSVTNLRILSMNDMCDPTLTNLGDAYKFDGTYQVSGVTANRPQIVKVP